MLLAEGLLPALRLHDAGRAALLVGLGLAAAALLVRSRAAVGWTAALLVAFGGVLGLVDRAVHVAGSL